MKILKVGSFGGQWNVFIIALQVGSPTVDTNAIWGRTKSKRKYIFSKKTSRRRSSKEYNSTSISNLLSLVQIFVHYLKVRVIIVSWSVPGSSFFLGFLRSAACYHSLFPWQWRNCFCHNCAVHVHVNAKQRDKCDV